ncbi:hypothetical protein EDD17DRAFT_466806 [Pisolithus thermaeus]|nr:hypothetical protein EDD17DRAFT_466806 [Pisolithus thermaeus]
MRKSSPCLPWQVGIAALAVKDSTGVRLVYASATPTARKAEYNGSAYTLGYVRVWKYLCDVPNTKSAEHSEAHTALFFAHRRRKHLLQGMRPSLYEKIMKTCEEDEVNTRLPADRDTISCRSDTVVVVIRVKHIASAEMRGQSVLCSVRARIDTYLAMETLNFRAVIPRCGLTIFSSAQRPWLWHTSMGITFGYRRVIYSG